MSKIKILIIDDSPVIRKLLAEMIATESDLDLVAQAPNGKIGLQKMTETSPDIVITDWEMPEMGGLETIEAIRKINPRIPIIVFSSLSQRGAQITLEALSRGASDYLTKPSSMGFGNVSVDTLKEQMLKKIRLFAPAYQIRNRVDLKLQPTLQSTLAIPSISRKLTIHNRLDAVVIGSSTGGPNALATVFESLPDQFPVPIFVVQHMPPVFTKSLAERLDKNSKLHVVEASSGLQVEAGCAYIAPGDFHMVLQKDGVNIRIQTQQGPPENSCRPAVDVLFRSAAEIYGNRVLAVVLTGMGQDGFKGCEVLNKKGAPIFAQDEATSVVWGMPSFIAKGGLANLVLPLNQIAGEISQMVSFNRLAGMQTSMRS